LPRAQAQQRNDVGAGDERVGDDRAVGERQRSDRLTGALTDQQRIRRTRRVVELGDPRQLARIVGDREGGS